MVLLKLTHSHFKCRHLYAVLQWDIRCSVQVLGPIPYSPGITSVASGPKTQEDQSGTALPSSAFWKVGWVGSTISGYLSRTKLTAQRARKVKGKKWLFLTPLFTAVFYWLDKIKYRNWSVSIPTHLLCSEQIKYLGTSKLAQMVVSHRQFHHSSPFSFPMKWTISPKWWLLIQMMFWKLKKKK